ncbi:MAG: hypothetical protein ACQEUT_18455 [Bacillota bacterium]
MKFPKEDMLMVVDGDAPDDHYSIIDQGDWINDGKYQNRETIFRYKGKFYSIDEGRSGSYFTEYYYDSEDWPEEVEATEVMQVPVTKYEWRAI